MLESGVLIASSDAPFRKRLAQSLRREPTFGRLLEAKNRAEVERVLARLAPLVLLLDLPMKGFSGLESLRTIRSLSPATRTILLADSPDDSVAVRALKEGARGYCPRKTDPALLLSATRLVREGEIWVGRKVIFRLIEELSVMRRARQGRADKRLLRLTRREREIVSLIAAGGRNKEIANRLSITERTVKAHLTSIFRKLGVSDRLHLAIYALDTRLPDWTRGSMDQSPMDQSPMDRGKRG